jgi:AcrR family transcriptional regulator
MTETVAASRPLRKDAARNRDLLIAAAREVFAEDGLDATLDDIARRAGLGVGTAYRHFANKYELVSALMDQLLEQFIASAAQALELEDPWQGLVVFLEEALVGQVNNRGLRQVLMGVHDQAKFDEVHDQLSGMLGGLLDRAKQSGSVREDIEATDIGFLISMLCSVADIAGDVDPELWRRYLSLCLIGLRPGATALDGPPLSEIAFRTAMATHKQTSTQIVRAGRD